jgi:hypothetical protein
MELKPEPELELQEPSSLIPVDVRWRTRMLAFWCVWRPPEASSPPVCVSPAFVFVRMSVLTLRLRVASSRGVFPTRVRVPCLRLS